MRPVRLIVRNSVRKDVGPYAVKLPGYATDDDPGKDSYAPFLVEAKPGDALRFDLINQLTVATNDSHINLHTHGLIVSPRPEHPCGPAGDNIFTDIPPTNSVSYRIDIPRKLPGSIFGREGSVNYPPGLYWFHAHIHGSAKNEITAGQAGLLSITPRDDAPATGAKDPLIALYAAQADHKPRYLALQDIQLAVDANATPDKPAAQGAKADWLSGTQYDPQACRPESYPPAMTPLVGSQEGFCGHTGVYDGNHQVIAGDSRSTVWLFTVNGQRYPDIKIDAGTSELWRVANLSATVTYVLEVVDDQGGVQDLHLVTMDGVVAGTPDAASPDHTDKVGVKLKQLLLMPASRAEILIQNTASSNADRILTLRSTGIETGGRNQPADNYAGDPWPAVKLARVIMKGSAARGPLESLLNVKLPRRGPIGIEVAAFTAPFKAGNPVVPPYCVTLPDKSYRRRITLDQTNSDFRLGSEVVDADGHSVDDPAAADRPHTIIPQAFAHVVPPEAAPHICARLGDTEVWELVNTTTEMHNFHIHQSKFRLSIAGDPGAPPGLTPEAAWRDPGNVITAQVPDLQAVRPVDKVDVWHDTIPVPPKDKAGNPGIVFITVPFKAREQVGTFVYHCHILEHEDGGMMATIQVYDPAQWATLPNRVRAASVQGAPEICGQPPLAATAVNYTPWKLPALSSLFDWE